jgi:hypothetical protein
MRQLILCREHLLIGVGFLLGRVPSFLGRCPLFGTESKREGDTPRRNTRNGGLAEG